MANQKETETAESRLTVPYPPFKTFLSFIDELSKTTVPVRVDRSVMRARSGSVQSLLRITLRFLGLIDEQDHSTEKLRELVKAYKTERWSQVFGDILTDAYLDVVGSLDLDNATAQQLHEAFRRGGATSSTLAKAVRFYLAAMRSADLTVSPHFAAPPRSQGQRRSRPSRRISPRPPGQVLHGQTAGSQGDTPPAESESLRFPRPGKSPVVFHIPDDLTTQEWEVVDATIRGFIGLRKNS